MFNENYSNEVHPDTEQSNTQQSNTQQQTGGWQNESRQGADQGGWQNESRQGADQRGWQNESRQGADQRDWQNETNYHDRYRSSQGRYSGQNYNSSQQSGYGSQGTYGQQNSYRNAYDEQNRWQNGYQGDGAKNGTVKKKNGFKIAIAAVLAVAFIAVCVGISYFAVDSIRNSLSASREQAGQIEEIQPEAQQGADASDEGAMNESTPQISDSVAIQESGQVTAIVTDVTDVVEKVMPACVSITNLSTYEIQNFWGQTFSQDSESSGSGIIIGQNDTELLVVSNNHVVEDADTLTVQFIDGQTAQALVKGTDSTVDLAVIAINLSDIPEETKEEICIASMGDSDSLKIGEPAIAIGNALGYGQSVTTGVISAINRTLVVSENGSSNALIQTDAAINPGNSGGALLNINGEVVGINSSKIGDSLVEGMGYAIPISTAKPIIEDLMSKETKIKVAEDERGYLGISCINVTSDIAANYNMPEGVFVAQVYEGTGADMAGLVRGNIITAFDGTEVRNQAELTSLTQYYKAGETVEITIMQGSPSGYQPKNVQITLSTIDEMNDAMQEQEQKQQKQSMPGYRIP